MAAETPPKPTYRADLDKLYGLPEHIRKHPYFCLWKWELNKNRDGWTKVPCNPKTGNGAQSTNSNTFAGFEETLDKYASGGYDGVGIGLFEGRSGIDIDHHLKDGELDEFARSIMDTMGAYTEISPSGDGIHILFVAEKFASSITRDDYRKSYYFNRSRYNGLEAYVCGLTNKFLTITGDTISEGNDGDKSDGLRKVLDTHMRRTPKQNDKRKSVVRGRANTSDDKLIRKAKASKKNGDKFSKLWDGDISDYGSHSEADQALCNMLVWWTNHDLERTDKLFRESGLYREKWERDDYRNGTIENADEDVSGGYDPTGLRVRKQSGSAINGNPTTIKRIDAAILTTDVITQEVNDINLGRAFARCYSHVLRYDNTLGRFRYYDGKRWVLDGKSMKGASRFVKRFYDRLLVVAASKLSGKSKDSYISDLLGYGSFTKRTNLLKDAASDMLCSPNDFDRDLNLLNVQNGTIDLVTFELLPHDPNDMITKIANVKYDQDAKCESWERFLLESLEGDVDTINYLQQQFGVSMAGDTSQEHMHFLYGRTRSGKSTCLETVRAVLGDYACGVSPATITKQKRNGQNASGDIARLNGVRYAVIPEPQKGMELSAEVVKMLTGNDTVTARQLYTGEVDFTPTVNIWVGTNHLPQIDDPTVLDSDRLVFIPFNNHLSAEQRDEGLKKRLQEPANLSGVLNWLLEGLSGYRTNRTPVPEVAQENTKAFEAQADRVKVFISEKLVKDDNAQVTARELWETWGKWASAGNADPNKGKQEFFSDLRRLGILRDRWNGKRNVCVGYRTDTTTTL